MSPSIVMAGLVPAIHVFLVFQRLIELLLQLNFPLDADRSHLYGGLSPFAEGRSAERLSVDGER